MLNAIKRSISFVLAFAMCLAFQTPVYANEGSEFTLPEDAVVLYQDENAILYQTNTETPTPRTPVDYESKWVDSTVYGDSFTIYNHRSGNAGVTWGVESSSESSYAQIWMTSPSGVVVLATRTVRPSSGEVVFRLTNSARGRYTVHFNAYTRVGIRVMCWMYD